MSVMIYLLCPKVSESGKGKFSLGFRAFCFTKCKNFSISKGYCLRPLFVGVDRNKPSPKGKVRILILCDSRILVFGMGANMI